MYKYLGILELDDILHDKMKANIADAYFNRLGLLLKSKLNSRNLITGINSWAVPVVRYSAGILNWNKEEIDSLDRKTRKLLLEYKAIHPRASGW